MDNIYIVKDTYNNIILGACKEFDTAKKIICQDIDEISTSWIIDEIEVQEWENMKIDVDCADTLAEVNKITDDYYEVEIIPLQE